MPNYRRWYVSGGSYFFTLVTASRAPIFRDAVARRVLRDAILQCAMARPFDLLAIVLLPDHLHMIWNLPPGDSEFSKRLASIKVSFTRDFLRLGGTEQSVTDSRAARGGRGVWQRRYHEHLIRDENDLERHLDYIHYNPVKHGLVQCPHQWRESTFQKFVERSIYLSIYPADWCCSCVKATSASPNFDWAEGLE